MSPPLAATQGSVRIALAQFNATVGDLDGNARRIVECAAQAHATGASLLVTPELALTGYPPEDLLLRPAFMRACAQALADLALALKSFVGLSVVVGHPHQFGDRGDRMHGEYKMPGGKLVVVDLQVRDGRIAQIQVSGDFFLEPYSALAAINVALSGQSISADQATLAAAVQRTLGTQAGMYGVSFEAIAIAVGRALGHGDAA